MLFSCFPIDAFDSSHSKPPFPVVVLNQCKCLQRSNLLNEKFFCNIQILFAHILVNFSQVFPLGSSSNFDHPNFSLTLCFSYSYTLYFKCGIQLRMKYTHMMACIELPCMKIRDIQKSINIFKSKLVYWITWETPSIYCHFIQKKCPQKGKRICCTLVIFTVKPTRCHHLSHRDDTIGVSYPGFSSGGTSSSISNNGGHGSSDDPDYFGMIFGSGSGSGAPPPSSVTISMIFSLLIILILYVTTNHGGVLLFL